MHSKIIQISKKPIEKEDYIDTDRYVENFFIGRIADYVTEVIDDRDELMQNLSDRFMTLDPKSNTLTVKDKEGYLKGKYDDFLYALSRLSKVDYKRFKAGIAYEICVLEASYNSNEIGLYVDDNDEELGLVPIDHFFRYAKDDDVFYIGAMFDYHF